MSIAFFVVGHFVLILTFALGCERKVNKRMEWWALSTKIWNNRAEFTSILWLRRIRKCTLSHIQMGSRFLSFLLFDDLIQAYRQLREMYIMQKTSSMKEFLYDYQYKLKCQYCQGRVGILFNNRHIRKSVLIDFQFYTSFWLFAPSVSTSRNNHIPLSPLRVNFFFFLSKH